MRLSLGQVLKEEIQLKVIISRDCETILALRAPAEQPSATADPNAKTADPYRLFLVCLLSYVRRSETLKFPGFPSKSIKLIKFG